MRTVLSQIHSLRGKGREVKKKLSKKTQEKENKEKKKETNSNNQMLKTKNEL